jgi:hypothetical protein
MLLVVLFFVFLHFSVQRVVQILQRRIFSAPVSGRRSASPGTAFPAISGFFACEIDFVAHGRQLSVGSAVSLEDLSLLGGLGQLRLCGLLVGGSAGEGRLVGQARDEVKDIRN